MSAVIYCLPPVYRIQYVNGEFGGVVEGFQTRKKWEAEVALFLLTEQHPHVFFWIIPEEKY